MAGVLGVSPWKTPVQVWLDKIGQSPLEGKDTITLRIGNELEDMVARLYTEQTGHPVQRFTRTIHKGCFLANIDRLVIPDGKKRASWRSEVRTNVLLECKTTSMPVWDQVPIYYLTQVFHYMGMIDCIERADVGCLFLLPKQFGIYPVDRDKDIISDMFQRGEEFWNKYVVPRIQPPPVNEADCKLLWQHSNPGKTVDSTKSIEGDLAHIKDLKGQIKKAEDELKEVEDTVKAFMGDA